jgi:hypothetical protein
LNGVVLELEAGDEPDASPVSEDEPDQMASEVAGQRMEAAVQNAGRREPSWPAAAREEKKAASGAESGDSLAKKKAGWRRLLCTFRFQYRMKAAFAVNGFTGSADDGVSPGRRRSVDGKRGGEIGGGENASADNEGRGNPRGIGKRCGGASLWRWTSENGVGSGDPRGAGEGEVESTAA